MSKTSFILNLCQNFSPFSRSSQVKAQRTQWIESLNFVEFLKPINECSDWQGKTMIGNWEFCSCKTFDKFHVWSSVFRHHSILSPRFCQFTTGSVDPNAPWTTTSKSENIEKVQKVLFLLVSMPQHITIFFLAVQDSSISDIVCLSVPWSQLTIRA